MVRIDFVGVCDYLSLCSLLAFGGRMSLTAEASDFPSQGTSWADPSWSMQFFAAISWIQMAGTLIVGKLVGSFRF